jgi:hypothetical protein
MVKTKVRKFVVTALFRRLYRSIHLARKISNQNPRCRNNRQVSPLFEVGSLLLWPDKLSLHVSSTKTLAYSETATIWNDFHYHLYDATRARFILSCRHYKAALLSNSTRPFKSDNQAVLWQ